MIHFYKKSLYWNPQASGYVIGTACGIERKQLLSPTSPPPPHSSVVFNWGVSHNPEWENVLWYNHPNSVENSANKINMTECFLEDELPCLEPINPREVDPSTMVVARHLLRSHSGNGIRISKASEVLPAPMYTKLENFRIEGRFFVVFASVVDYVQKKKMGKEKRELNGILEVNPYVKSHKNGWVFARNDIEKPSDKAYNLALKAFNAVGLDYGAVDIAWNDPEDPVVIEVNSAPGFVNTQTIKLFSNKLREFF
jgi:hypothetical protein